MTDHTQRFTGRSIDYEQYRERYDPAIVLPLLHSWCGLTPDWLIADIGAGTGMLADIFLANGNRVLAIEPNAEMRSACSEAHKDQSLLTVIDGTAEATTLAEHTVDLVCAGRALHWFNLDRAFDEFRWILKPGGWFVSVAFGRADDGREENVAFEELLREYTPERTPTREAYKNYARLPDAFPRDYHFEDIRGEFRLAWPEFFGLTRSLSHSPQPTSETFPAFERALRHLFDRFAAGGLITFSTRYWINAGRF